MISKNSLPLILLFSSLLIMSCGAQKNAEETSKFTPKQMSDSQNNFSFELFKHVMTLESDAVNPLISPQSIFMDFAMLYNGASGRTKSAIDKALQLKGMDINALNTAQSELLENFPKIDTSVTITIANAIWYRKDRIPQNSFLSVNQEFYHAKIQDADFSDPQTKTAINNWVSENTNGKIPTIIDNISPGEVMFLLNAVYFKGQWKDQFNPNLTRDLVFHAKAKEKKVPFMYKDKRYNYLRNDQLQMVELPYGNGQFSMWVLLPAENYSLSKLTESLNVKSFAGLVSEMESTSIKLYLPKWESSFSADNLKENLSALGMGIAFENNAEFSGVFEKESTKISQIKHKTYIKVDEEGTEAAAATSIGMVTTSMPMPSQEEMKVDRPFVYLITEKNSETILFLGVVQDPEE